MRRSLDVVWRSTRSLLLGHSMPPQTCCFSVCHPAMSNVKREARFMKKIMGQHESKKKMYFFDRVESTPPSNGPRPYNRRRMSMLNKLFMKNITEVLATGSASQTIEGLGVEIGKVSITPDFQFINVFYVCKKKPRPPDLGQILTDAGYRLRHDLSQLRLMGEVPRVIFVEDKTLQRLDEIEEILSTADKGSDEPSPELSEEIDLQEEENLEMFNTSQRAYRLDHTKILDKVMAAKKAASPFKRKQDTLTVQEGVPFSPSGSIQTVQPTNTNRGNKESPKQLITKFLKESNQCGRPF